MRKAGRIIAALMATGFACAAYVYLTLPDVRHLRKNNPQTTAFMELRAREARAKGEDARRVQKWVPYSRISQHLKRAVIVTEDAAFWRHDGLDYQQIKESMEVNLERGEFVRGASTVSQQLAKNLYLSPSKNPLRKIRELLITRRLEAELSKQRILEIYLNVIEWGDGIWGAEAAARTYFRKSAADLAPSEAALLAGAIRNPRILSPASPNARLRNLQQIIMRRMGAVTPPPVIADTSVPPSAAPEAVSPTPVLPETSPVPPVPAQGVPPVLPGETLPPQQPPPPKPCPTPPCGLS